MAAMARISQSLFGLWALEHEAGIQSSRKKHTDRKR